MHKYSPRFFACLVSLCVLGFVLAAIASAFPPSVNRILNTIGGTILLADMVLVLVADWKGFLTLNGFFDWDSMSHGKRVLLGLLYCVFGPFLLAWYLIQIARYQPPAPAAPQEAQQ